MKVGGLPRSRFELWKQCEVLFIKDLSGQSLCKENLEETTVLAIPQLIWESGSRFTQMSVSHIRNVCLAAWTVR